MLYLYKNKNYTYMFNLFVAQPYWELVAKLVLHQHR